MAISDVFTNTCGERFPSLDELYPIIWITHVVYFFQYILYFYVAGGDAVVVVGICRLGRVPEKTDVVYDVVLIQRYLW